MDVNNWQGTLISDCNIWFTLIWRDSCIKEGIILISSRPLHIKLPIRLKSTTAYAHSVGALHLVLNKTGSHLQGRNGKQGRLGKGWGEREREKEADSCERAADRRTGF